MDWTGLTALGKIQPTLSRKRQDRLTEVFAGARVQTVSSACIGKIRQNLMICLLTGPAGPWLAISVPYSHFDHKNCPKDET